MSRGPSTFRQRDVTAAVKAIEAAGKEVCRVEIGKDGKIIIITSRESAEPEPGQPHPWDGRL